jgi:polysaccharide biosynthesis/export protein
MPTWIRVVTCAALIVTTGGWISAQQRKPATDTTPYVIGAGDVLSISLHGQDPSLHAGDVVVRPDGKIWRYMIDEVQASGLTPAELREELTRAYSKYFGEPTVILHPKEFNSRKVGITGGVLNSGEFVLYETMTILELITKAGGLQEYADRKNIRLLRRLPGNKIETIVFNYDRMFEGKGLDTLPMLVPGDQVVVNIK